MRKTAMFLVLLVFFSLSSVHAQEAVYVGSKDIKLLLSITDTGSGMSEMWFSTEKDTDGNWISWSVRESYMNEKNITLPDGPDGEYCIAGMFSDNVNNETVNPIIACCIVDTTIPSGATDIDGITVNVNVTFE